ncbi:uncharacterized protein JCM6883_004649 [Sporobolomyces salmoneus]|uniref:uncharacterized protein n=1 Tax=Sporobolomyces salmoneus TaxID=183962 RepID=UPI00316F3438
MTIEDVVRALEEELFPVVAVERSLAGRTFEEVRIARGLSGLTIIFVVGVSAFCFVKRNSRVRLPISTVTPTFLSSRNLFLFFTFLNSALELLYLFHLPNSHSTINLASHAFRNCFYWAQAIFHLHALTGELVARIGDLGGSAGKGLKWLRGGRFKIASRFGGTVLLSSHIAVSANNLSASFALRESFHKAQTSLLHLPTTSSSSGVTTATILKALASPIELIQRDLRSLRRSEIAKDSVELASQVTIILVALILLSNVSSYRPRFSQPLRRLPKRIVFKRMSSISKLPVIEDVPTRIEIAEESNDRPELRRSALAVATLAGSVFLFALLTNCILALDVLGRRWTAPLQSCVIQTLSVFLDLQLTFPLRDFE